MRRAQVLSTLAALALLGGCATAPTGPTVMALPGSQKSFDQFRADGAVCSQYAQSLVGDASQAASNNAAANVAAATAFSAAVGAILGSVTGQAGQGAAIGAGAGLLYGSAAGANAAGWTYQEAQRRFDMAYTQCMFARGNLVPGSAPGRVSFRAPGYAAQPGNHGSNYQAPNSQAPNYPPPDYPAPNLPPPNAPAPTVGSQPTQGSMPALVNSAPSAYAAPGSAPKRIPAPAMTPPTSGAAPASVSPGPYQAPNYPPPNTPPPPGYGPAPS